MLVQTGFKVGKPGPAGRCGRCFTDDAVQINVSGNDIEIDVYVDFEGDESLTTDNETPCKDLAIAGIENWSGNYLDVFGEDVTVTVNVYEGDSSISDSQKYVKLYLETGEGVPNTGPADKSYSNSSDRELHMYRVDSRKDPQTGLIQKNTYSDDEYARTVSHEMGHAFGIGDGYKDKRPLKWYEKIGGVTRRPDASKLGLIDDDDIMRYQFDRLNISNTDIGMLILAYQNDEWQSFADYTGHKQSEYFHQEGKR